MLRGLFNPTLLIWLLWFTLIFAMFRATASPFMGVLLLLITRASLAVIGGLFSSSWLFLITILVYVGGMIVIFVYLTRIISATKVFGLSPRLSGIIIALAFPLVIIHYVRPLADNRINWISQILSSPISTLVVYRIFYLLEALIIVFLMSRKLSGPLKTTP